MQGERSLVGGGKRWKDESDSWQNVCPDSLSAVADEYGCQLFRANCYSPSARSVNQRDWRRVAALRVARGVPRFPRHVVPPLLFSPLPPLVNYSTILENNYIPSTALIAPTQTHDFGGKLLERDDGWKVWHEWNDASHSNVYKDQEFVGRLRSFMVFESRYLTRCSLLKNINYKFSHLLLFLLHSY